MSALSYPLSWQCTRLKRLGYQVGTDKRTITERLSVVDYLLKIVLRAVKAFNTLGC